MIAKIYNRNESQLCVVKDFSEGEYQMVFHFQLDKNISMKTTIDYHSKDLRDNAFNSFGEKEADQVIQDMTEQIVDNFNQ